MIPLILVTVVSVAGIVAIVLGYLSYLSTLKKPPLGGRWAFTVLGPTSRNQGVDPMIEVSASGSEKFRLQVKPKTLGGNPATIETASLKVTPVEASGEETETTKLGENPVATIESADTFSVQADRPTAADVTVTVFRDFLIEGDADLGAGVKTISEVVRLTIPLEQAGVLGVTELGAVPR